MRDSDGYDADDNARKCYDVAVSAMRERLATFRCEQIGPHRLYLGDCRELMPLLPTVDVIVTDPPYGADDTHAGHLSNVILRNGEHSRQALRFEGITSDDLLGLATEWCDKARRWVVFSCEWKFIHRLDEAGLLVRFGIWRKPDGAPQFTGDRPGTGWEAIAICHRPGKKQWNGGGRHAFWSVPKMGKYGHPTEKPQDLIGQWVRDFSNVGETILDPFMGSGTTGAACVRAGRKFIGIEMDAGHFETARARIEKAVNQPDLFVDSSAAKPEQLSLLGDA